MDNLPDSTRHKLLHRDRHGPLCKALWSTMQPHHVCKHSARVPHTVCFMCMYVAQGLIAFLLSYSINVENAHSGNIKMLILATVKCINWT